MNNNISAYDVLVDLRLEREAHEESKKYIMFLEHILRDNGFVIYPYDDPRYDVYDVADHTICVVDSERVKQYNFYRHY